MTIKLNEKDKTVTVIFDLTDTIDHMRATEYYTDGEMMYIDDVVLGGGENDNK